jgi:adenosylcobinamide-GDP ribazoletransferase
MTRLEQEREAPKPRPAASIRSTLLEHYQSLLVAVQFLTRLPTPRVELSDESGTRLILGRSAAYFPLVGALIGTMTGATILLAGRLWPIGLAVAIGLVVEAVITGAFHEDAVADFCDAFGGGWTRDDILRILKDSRIGSFGALGLGLAVVLRGGAIASLETDRLIAAVSASATLGRWAILPAMWALPPIAARESLSRDVGQQIGPKRLGLGTVMAIPGYVGLALQSPGRAAIAIVAVLVLSAWLVRYVGRKLGGINGDSLGFLCYASQVIVLLTAGASWPSSPGGMR